MNNYNVLISIKNIILGCFFFFISLLCHGQDSNIKSNKVVLRGLIVDDSGDLIPGVSIIENGSSNGTTTDSDGNFQLKVHKGANISINVAGMSTFSYKVDDEVTNIRVNIEQNLIEFCCISHDPAHCAETIGEMKKLSKDHKCSFK